MLAGIVFGVIDKNNATEIETCLQDGKGEAELAYDAFTHIEQGTKEELVTGFSELASVVEALPATLTQCKSIASDVAELQSWAAAVLEVPTADLQATIKANCLSHAVALTLDVRKSRKLWVAEEYFQFGAELGTMLVIATTF